MHPFDSRKYCRIYDVLIAALAAGPMVGLGIAPSWRGKPRRLMTGL
jgi:hypothetical protein